MFHAILSPHFDDAVLSCWRLMAGPADVTVVNVFTAEPPAGTPPPWWDRATGASDPVERMRERRREDAAALALTGTSSVEIGLLDDQYRPPSSRCMRSSSGSASSLPRRRSSTPRARSTAIQTTFSFATPRWSSLARVGRSCCMRICPTRPLAAGRRGCLGVVSAGERCRGRLGPCAQGSRARRAQPRPEPHPLDAPTRTRKLQALALYESQRAALDRYAFAPLDDPRALAWEVSWEVPSSALRGMEELTGEPVVADLPSQPLDDRV